VQCLARLQANAQLDRRQHLRGQHLRRRHRLLASGTELQLRQVHERHLTYLTAEQQKTQTDHLAKISLFRLSQKREQIFSLITGDELVLTGKGLSYEIEVIDFKLCLDN
jgi:hypothetical protein